MSFLCASNQSSELHVKLRNSQFLKTKGTSKSLELNNSFSEPHETSERQILSLFLMLLNYPGQLIRGSESGSGNCWSLAANKTPRKSKGQN